MDRNNNEETKKKYKEAKKWAKRAVARAKAEAYQHLYKAMETPDGLNMALRIAKQRSKNSKDITQPKMIKDEQGNILKEDEDIKSRWHRYFCELLNEENERIRREADPEVYKKEVKAITEDEVAVTLYKMKNGKAVGPDNIPVKVWKCFGTYGVTYLTKLFNNILQKEEMPKEWRRSVLVPIYKNKGDIMECGSFRGIKLMSHTMKTWERIVDNRIRSEVVISQEQFGFMKGRSTEDAIFALRQLLEKYKEGQRKIHCTFIDL